MTKNMTYAQALEIAINALGEGEVADKLTALKASIEKRNAGDRKPTKTQVENEQFKDAILATLERADRAMTIKELQTECAAIAGLTNQRITHMLTDLRKDGKIMREYVKKIPYFAIGAEEADE